MALKAILKLCISLRMIILGKIACERYDELVNDWFIFFPSVLANLLALASLGFFTPSLQPFLTTSVCHL